MGSSRNGIAGIARAVPSESCTAVSSFTVRASARPTWNTRCPTRRRPCSRSLSFSKSLTCVCLAMLMDEGKISPDDDLRKFIPEMHPFDPPIRIRDMVRCRSGLWDQIALPILVGWENAPLQHPHTEADFLSLLAGQKTLPFQPGSQYRYSSGDYFLLGLIVKRISGQSLAEFAQEARLRAARHELAPSSKKTRHASSSSARSAITSGVGDAWHLWRPTAYLGRRRRIEDMRGGSLLAGTRTSRTTACRAGKYLDEFFREGTLLGNRSCPRSWMPLSRKTIRRRGATRRPASTAGSGAGNSRVVRGASVRR